MLSIRFAPQREWWVSGTVFDRLFQSALDHGEMPLSLQYWRDVADANGGISVWNREPEEAGQFASALRQAAERELSHNPCPEPDQDTYSVSLKKLMNVLSAN
jgi:hypothetical protein